MKKTHRLNHLLSVSDLTDQQIHKLIMDAHEFKTEKNFFTQTLKNKNLALLFEKPSLRTRASFEVGIKQLGGNCVYFNKDDIGIGEREPIPDISNVISRWFDGIIARVFSHETLRQLQKSSLVPVINALSDLEHPCQALSDMLTIHEKLGQVAKTRIVFIGDGNNVAASLALSAAALGANFVLCSPENYKISESIWKKAVNKSKGNDCKIEWCDNPKKAVATADVIYTDVWISMGNESESRQRIDDFQGYQVTPELLSLAKSTAIFMHDMPAHEGEEISTGLLNHSQSVVFDQAENRLHMQKAILSSLLE